MTVALRRGLSVLMAVVGIVAALAVVAAPTAARPDVHPRTTVVAESESPAMRFTYSVATRGTVYADAARFAAHVARTLADPRGWSLGGALEYVQVATGGDFTVWLAAPETLPQFSSHCSSEWSCRVGRDVVINDRRWREGSHWPGLLDQYQHYLVNHEMGHWHGLGHEDCSEPGGLAPTMMQQSKGLDGCVATTWPLEHERVAVARRRGVTARPAVLEPAPRIAAAMSDDALYAAAPDGRVWWLGEGAVGPVQQSSAVVGIAADPDGAGYWLATADGAVQAVDAADYGSLTTGLNAPIVDIAAHPSGRGYWLVAADGGVFSFGAARFAGSMGADSSTAAVVGIAADPDGDGYWLATSEGAVVSFEARFHGSLAHLALRAPVVDIVSGPHGYRLLGADGDVFAFNEPFHGSAAATGGLFVSLTPTSTSDGYWLADEAGEIIAFGAAPEVADVPEP